MKAFFQDRYNWRRLLVMLFSNIIMAIGIGLFKVSLTGNDPCTALMIAIGSKIGVDFSIVLIVINGLFFAVEFGLERKLVGIGTLINWFLIGPVASFFERQITALFGTPGSLPVKLAVMTVGVLVLSFSCALYQTANMGISPYDSLSIIFSHRTPLPYFWCRIITDSLCTIVAFCLGGLLGIGTLVCALGLGPFITFFTKHVAEKLLPKKNGGSENAGEPKQ